jgi:uncharacterized surface protein with fasciclin (FAS1) repeats
MRVSRFLPLALATSAAAQSLQAALESQNSSLSALISLIQTQPQLVAALSNATNLTILAPTNKALDAFLNQSSTSSALTADPGLATALLYYHILNGTYYASSLNSTTPQFIPTLLTNQTYENVTGGQVVEVVSSAAGNVTIYSALKENATVVTPNVNFTGGTIHIIDSVLSIPQNDSATAVAANLTDVAGALMKANLVNTVDGLHNVTIFAPANSAFDRIGNLLPNLTTQQLTSILEYHVVEGTIAYSSLIKNESIATVQGSNVTLTVVNGTVYVNSAKVILADVLVANGVVHVLDNVLNPGNATVTANASASSDSPAFAGATSTIVSDLTSGIQGPTSTAPAATQATASSSTGAAVPMATGAIGAAALFGGAVAYLNM